MKQTNIRQVLELCSIEVWNYILWKSIYMCSSSLNRAAIDNDIPMWYFYIQLVAEECSADGVAITYQMLHYSTGRHVYENSIVTTVKM